MVEDDHSFDRFAHVENLKVGIVSELLDRRFVRPCYSNEGFDESGSESPVSCNGLRKAAKQQGEHGTLDPRKVIVSDCFLKSSK